MSIYSEIVQGVHVTPFLLRTNGWAIMVHVHDGLYLHEWNVDLATASRHAEELAQEHNCQFFLAHKII